MNKVVFFLFVFFWGSMIQGQSIVSGGFISFSISQNNDSVYNNDAGGLAMFHNSYNKCLISQGGNIFGESKIFDKIGDFDDHCVQKREKLKISVYPNPSFGIFTIKGEAIGDIDIMDNLGRLVIKFKSNQPKSGEQIIDISNQTEGNYFMRVQNADGNFTIISIVKINQ